MMHLEIATPDWMNISEGEFYQQQVQDFIKRMKGFTRLIEHLIDRVLDWQGTWLLEYLIDRAFDW